MSINVQYCSTIPRAGLFITEFEKCVSNKCLFYAFYLTLRTPIAEGRREYYLALILSGMSAEPDHAMDATQPTACAEAHDRSMPGSFDSSDPTGIRPRAVLDDILNSVRKGLLRRSAALHLSVSLLTKPEHRRLPTTVRRALTLLTGAVLQERCCLLLLRSLSMASMPRVPHLTACLCAGRCLLSLPCTEEQAAALLQVRLCRVTVTSPPALNPEAACRYNAAHCSWLRSAAQHACLSPLYSQVGFKNSARHPMAGLCLRALPGSLTLTSTCDGPTATARQGVSPCWTMRRAQAWEAVSYGIPCAGLCAPACAAAGAPGAAPGGI